MNFEYELDCLPCDEFEIRGYCTDDGSSYDFAFKISDVVVEEGEIIDFNLCGGIKTKKYRFPEMVMAAGDGIRAVESKIIEAIQERIESERAESEIDRWIDNQEHEKERFMEEG